MRAALVAVLVCLVCATASAERSGSSGDSSALAASNSIANAGSTATSGSDVEVSHRSKAAASSAASLYVASCMSGASVQALGGGGALVTSDTFCKRIMAYQMAADECSARPTVQTASGGKCDSGECLNRNPICDEVQSRWEDAMFQLEWDEPAKFWRYIAKVLPRSLRWIFE